ncbi:complement C4-B isoform X2 [Osmerus eperlanus]|uniref:complement C4-B isoform X2 n=1 Tax=Osmerus eperlanus TaxID=29151 RepID=UPI002E0D8245
MGSPICLLVFLVLAVEPAQAIESFFISAPNVFHIGVKEQVLIHVGETLLNKRVTVYLEVEIGGTLISERISTICTQVGQFQTVELEIDKEKMSKVEFLRGKPPYLLLVSEIASVEGRQFTRVLVSKHQGYIFIQTDQPIYNPTQKVNYRVFTLDHSMRPVDGIFKLSVFNAAGNRIKKALLKATSGIFSSSMNIPDVSKMGTWRIVAHYEDDEKEAAIREFRVQKFVMPSFEVTILPEQNYLLVNQDHPFTIQAMYSYGETIKGAFHCRVGVRTVNQGSEGEKETTVFIRGLELTGTIINGLGATELKVSRLDELLQNNMNTSLSDLDQSGAKLHIAASVTDITSGELQEAEVFLPVVSQVYYVDLSRTRSHFIPGFPLYVSVVVSLPDGSPAEKVKVDIQGEGIQREPNNVLTNQQGVAGSTLAVPADAKQITVQVTVNGHQKNKIIKRVSSSSNSYLYIKVDHTVFSVEKNVDIRFHTNAKPKDGYIYYMVLSRGVLITQKSVRAGEHVTASSFQITHAMIPSFRLIGFYYLQNGDIIADSVWVDVEDECEGKLKISSPTPGPYLPGSLTKVTIDLEGQKGKVALMVVDKAIYALNAQNKLTAKQVFSSMQSYDLGCSYGGGQDMASVLNDAGLSFMSASTEKSQNRQGLGCHKDFRRRRRSLNLQLEMMTIKSKYTDDKLQECCVRGLTLIPMRRTCEERAKRVSLTVKDPNCTQAFKDCCLQGEKLRDTKKKEDKGLGREASETDIEEFFFDASLQNIRRSFPPSFAFTVIEVDGKKDHTLSLHDSITTWEIQAVSLSKTHGFCVAEPFQMTVFKNLFVSLRLPYSVKQYEQLSIVPVIHNYGENPAELAVHMVPTEGLCSPGSASVSTYVNITVAQQSSKSVPFSAVPMAIGTIPITIRIYDRDNEFGVDAIEKLLNVRTEGIEEWKEETHVLDLKGRSDGLFTIDGQIPDNSVPGSSTNIFVRLEGEGFGQTTTKTLLSPEGVKRLLKLPTGCAEQTMTKLAPLALALRYLDMSQRWFELPAGTRDTALHNTESGYTRILTFKKNDGSYGAWTHTPSSYWLTGLVVKVLSLVAERQALVSGEKGRITRVQVVSHDDITVSVQYLLSKQNDDGSFIDPNPVYHREIQGGVGGLEGEESMTAFITLALNRSLAFLPEKEKNDAKDSIVKSTSYLRSRLDGLERPYAVAITAYCLAICLPDPTQAQPAWKKLQGLATKDTKGCRVWRANAELVSQEKNKRIPGTEAITVETTAYALLTAVAHKDSEWAESAACWLTTQENYGGGFKSTQDTIVALEALSEYALDMPPPPVTEVEASFTVKGKSTILKLSLGNTDDKVETELKPLMGKNIDVIVKGQGKAKMKVLKAYHLIDPRDDCQDLKIEVTIVKGRVLYTDKVPDYAYGEDYGEEARREEEDFPSSSIEWFDARTRHKRDTEQSIENEVLYEVCVSYSLSRNLSGMAIADITLLSGFEAQTDDLEKLKDKPEEYISHYETSHGRVLIYFNEMFENEECITFRAVQRILIGLLQPAQALFYDYYEPARKCAVLYSAPQRSKMVAQLCEGSVCQCAERPCHKERTFSDKPMIGEQDRQEHACKYPLADYGYQVEVLNVTVKGNFELYTTNVVEVLRTNRDMKMDESQIRVFAKRLHCKGKLQKGKQYLIMGKDGLTTDTSGRMQYLLESTNWIEQIPSRCKGTRARDYCAFFNKFVFEYRLSGCTQ